MRLLAGRDSWLVGISILHTAMFAGWLVLTVWAARNGLHPVVTFVCVLLAIELLFVTVGYFNMSKERTYE